ncbi:plasmid pRiA4b ORF-3 family protein [Bacillus sp. 2205SS5-2]|uniref:plasmid pRiA4b ORF-3 family protein n=1 Tax=Bacillus sp. 2205SS5-2 TaxID=3109031 RepID=UPI0030048AB2
MLIQCTKKLLDELKVTPDSEVEENPLFAWHANLLNIGRKKTVVLVNDANRYAIVLYGLKAKDMKNIDQLIRQAIQKTFQAESMKDEVIEQFIQQANRLVFAKTKDRTSVARMNKVCENVYCFEDVLDHESIIQAEMSTKINTLLAGDGKNSYIYPNEELYKQLEVWVGQAIFQSEAVELKITLELENFSVWRRITVPVNFTFEKLHHVVQAAFGWENCHLHEFNLYPSTSGDNVIPITNEKPFLNLVGSREAFNFPNDVPVKMETGIKLVDYLSAKIEYNYDFGDGWQHIIEVEKVIDDYRLNYPICLAGEGNAPPEDVGGEPGYEEFIRIIGDETHPDYEHMVSWGRGQGYREFDMKDVNRRLRNGG